MTWLKATWTKLRNWWIRFNADLAPTPEQLRSGTASEGMRPVPIELGFYLHANGRVYKRSRAGDGDRRVDNEDIKEMVYREYDELVRIAKREQSLARMMMNALRKRS